MKRMTIQVPDLTHAALEVQGSAWGMNGTDFLKHVVTTSGMGHDIPLNLGPIVTKLRKEREGIDAHPQLPLPPAAE